MRLIVSCCLALFGSLIDLPNLAGQESFSGDSSPVLGWNGIYVVGSWSEVAIDFVAPKPGPYTICVTAPDPDGHRVTFKTTSLLPLGRQRLKGYFKTGQTNPSISVEVKEELGGPLLNWTSSDFPTPGPIAPSVQLIVTVGKPQGFNWDSVDSNMGPGTDSYRTVEVPVESLPDHRRFYESLSLLVIAGNTILSERQADAVHQWVTGGGRVVISLPQLPATARQVLAPLASWIPVTVSENPVTISEFAKLEFYARRNVRVPFVGRMPIPGIKVIEGDVLAGSRDEVLLSRSPCGLGSVSILALDLTQPPLTKWTELPALGKRLAETADNALVAEGPSRNMQLSTTGITDLATQLHAVQDDFASVSRASLWFVMGMLVLFLLAIGPLDYYLVHRLLKWPRGTWLTLPTWVALAVLLSAQLASSWNGASLHINELNIVNIDVQSSTCHQRLWTNIYSPSTVRKSVTIRSKMAPGDPLKQSVDSCWSGIAESSYGGMLRPSGVTIGPADYELTSGASIANLPLLQWSSKELSTEIHCSADGMVDCELQFNGMGQLSGTLLHRLPGSLEDWFLTYGNRVYRHKKRREDSQSLPLPSGQLLRVDQPNVFPRDLRAFLTGKVATGKAGTQAADVASQFVNYDPLSRNPEIPIRILTFHNEVGGARYTGLTNRLLESEDLSHLLKLGRAVLFGRLKADLVDVRLNDAQIKPDAEATFVRIILPVKKVGTNERHILERFDVP